MCGFPVSDPSWQLDAIFEGGAGSAEFAAFLEDLDERLERLEERVVAAPSLREAAAERGAELGDWVDLLEELQEVVGRLHEASAFAGAQSAAHTDEEAAAALPQRVDELSSGLERIDRTIVQRFRGAADEVLERLEAHDELEGLGLYLREYRRRADRAMSEAEERLAADLGRDGMHAWGSFYRLSSGRLTAEIEDETGGTEEISVARAHNRLSDSDRNVRRRAHAGLQEAWSERAAEYAAALSHILGARQTLIDRRGEDPLTQPLEQNRLQRESLTAMMEAVDAIQPVLHEYLDAKAAALGVEELEWYDLRAPVGASSDAEIGWERAQAFVVEQVGSFSDEMASFYRKALAERWVEAEERDGKASGGFCSPFPVSEEVRVFMTFSGSMSQVMVLAHELGHAYHFWRLRGLPAAARKVPMTLAETASTLSEKVVESAALESAGEGRVLRLLDERLQRAATFLLDVPARFRLERRLHRARREGPIGPTALTELSREAFEESFGELLGSFDDYHWASKNHYYLSRHPFYNFPYTVGYLFSKAVHDRVRRGDESVRERLDELLRVSGRWSAESVAEEFLGADLGDPGFWSDAAASLREDVDRYRMLVEESAR